MTEDEVVLIARYVRAVCPQQKIDEFTSDAWEDFLLPYSVDETRAAVHRHVARGNAFISIGEIVAEIRKARSDRLARHTEAEPPHGDLDDDSYRAALLGERRAIADGRTNPVAVPALPSGLEPAMYEGRGRALLRSVGREAVSRRPEFAAACSHCLAPSGRPCVSGKGELRRDAHPSRIEASRAVAAGGQPLGHQAVADEIERRKASAAVHVGRLTTEQRAELDQFQQQLRADDRQHDGDISDAEIIEEPTP